MSGGVVLAFDTATAATVVGLSLDGRQVSSLADRPPGGAGPRHAETLLALCEQALAEGSIRWADLDRIGVGVGPGTFTGLRIGVSTGRGLAQASGAEMVAVSSLEALSLPARAQSPGGSVAAVIDARRGEAYVACWGPDGVRRLAPAAAGPDRLVELICADGGELMAVGDGALIFRNPLQNAAITVPDDDSQLHQLQAAALCQLAAAANPAETAELIPDYIRLPDAEMSQGEVRDDND